MNKKFDRHHLQDTLVDDLHKVGRYSLLIFLVFLAAIYGFVLYRINTLSSSQPSQDTISQQITPTTSLHVDTKALSQLQSLQDNSVSVQTLFNQARDNPFQE